MTEVDLVIDGMMCGMCEAHIKDALRKRLPEAKHLKADHVNGTASFEIDEAMPEHMLRHEIEAELHPLGYELTSISTKPVEKKKGLFGHFGK